jgi:Family of unknown function (DUF6152)
MVSRLVLLLSLVVSLLMVPRPVDAHHAEANYDHENLWVFKGMVTQFDFVNPHVILHFEVKTKDGQAEQWVGTESSPNAMRRYGWSQSTAKQGDSVVVSGFREKDGRLQMQIAIFLVNGKEFQSSTTAAGQLDGYEERNPGKAPHNYN